MRPTILLHLLGTPNFHALVFVTASAAAVELLIAIWAATNRRHWFWRALAVVGAVMGLAPIRAYEPALIFAISSPVTIALVLIIQRAKSPSGSNHNPARDIRYGLRDILLLMVIVGLALSGFLHLRSQAPKWNAADAASTASTLTAVATAAWVLANSSRRWRAGLLLVLVVATSSLAIPYFGTRLDDFELWQVLGVGFMPLPSGGAPSTFREDIRIVAMFLGELALLLLVPLVLTRWSGRQTIDQPPARWPIARGLLVAWTLLLGLLLAAVYWQMLWLAPLPPAFSTALTNYPRLIEIARRMPEIAAAPQLNAGQRQERDDLIAEVMTLARHANYIPFDPATEANRRKFEGIWEDSRLVRNLVRALDGEASAALLQGDDERAWELRLANIRLGLMLERGGTIPDLLVGIAVHSVTLGRLTAERRDLSSAQARRVVEAWEQILAESEDVNLIVTRDRATSDRAYGWGARLNNIVDQAGIRSDIWFAYREAEQRWLTSIRLLQTDLAIRVFQREHGELPQSLAKLAPAYLPAVPLDPFSGKPLVYRRQGDAFILYSVGHDRADDGGAFTNTTNYYARDVSGKFVTGYDFDLDTLTRP